MTDMMLLCRDDHKEMIALAINLALNKSNAEQMIENNRLHNLMSRAFKSQNYLLMKVIRNISEHKTLQTHFVVIILLFVVCVLSNFLLLNIGIRWRSGEGPNRIKTRRIRPRMYWSSWKFKSI